MNSARSLLSAAYFALAATIVPTPILAQPVSGPLTSTNRSIPVFTSTNGKVLGSSPANVDTTGNLWFGGTGTLIVNDMTSAQRNTLSPTNGMVIYNTTTSQLERYENNVWTTFGGVSGSPPGGLTGQLQYNAGGTAFGGVTRGSLQAHTNLNDLGLSWISVKNYGAVGDNVADDTAAIQSAFNAATVYGPTETNVFASVIYFPRGIYKLTDTLYPKVGASRLQLIGDGFSGSESPATLRMTDPNKTILEVSTNAVNVFSIRGLQFEGTGKGTGTGNGVVLGYPTTTMFDSIIENCWFVNIPATCIKGTRMADYKFVNNGIEGSDKGIWIDNTMLTGANYVDHGSFNQIGPNNTFYSLNTAVLLQFGYMTRVHNNSFQYCGTASDTNAAIVFERLGTNVENRNTMILGNVFDRGYHDIYLHGDGTLGAHTGLSGVNVVGNSSDFADRSFARVDGANEVIFSGNKVNDCSATASLFPAFHILGNATRPGFHANTVTKSGSFGPTYGLYCETNVSQINLGHNRWFGVTADVRIDRQAVDTFEANGDFQSTAIGVHDTFGLGSVDLPMGYALGLYGTNGLVSGGVGNIKAQGAGKQLVFGYDFPNDRGVLNAVDQGVGYKPLLLNNGMLTITTNRVGLNNATPGYRLSMGNLGEDNLTLSLFENAGGANLFGVGHRTNASNRLAFFANGAEVAAALQGGPFEVYGNAVITGTNTVGALTITNGAASSILRLDASKRAAAVTVGTGLTWDGTTLSATGGGTNAALSIIGSKALAMEPNAEFIGTNGFTFTVPATNSGMSANIEFHILCTNSTNSGLYMGTYVADVRRTSTGYECATHVYDTEAIGPFNLIFDDGGGAFTGTSNVRTLLQIVGTGSSNTTCTLFYRIKQLGAGTIDGVDFSQAGGGGDVYAASNNVFQVSQTFNQAVNANSGVFSNALPRTSVDGQTAYKDTAASIIAPWTFSGTSGEAIFDGPVSHIWKAQAGTALDWRTNSHRFTGANRLTANKTLTFNNATDNRSILILFEQDAAGGHLITWPSDIDASLVSTNAANMPQINTNAGKFTAIGFERINGTNMCTTFLDGVAVVGAGSGDVVAAGNNTLSGSNTFSGPVRFTTEPLNSSLIFDAVVKESAGYMTNGSTTLTVTGGALVAGDVGKTVSVWQTDRVFTDAIITNAMALLVSTNADFTAVDLGKTVEISGAGAAGVSQVATISTVDSEKQVTLSGNASTYVSNAVARIISIPHVTTIATLVNATNVTLAAAPTITLTNAHVVYGTDNRVALSNDVASAQSANRRLVLGSGKALVLLTASDPWATALSTNSLNVTGTGKGTTELVTIWNGIPGSVNGGLLRVDAQGSLRASDLTIRGYGPVGTNLAAITFPHALQLVGDGNNSSTQHLTAYRTDILNMGRAVDITAGAGTTANTRHMLLEDCRLIAGVVPTSFFVPTAGTNYFRRIRNVYLENTFTGRTSTDDSAYANHVVYDHPPVSQDWEDVETVLNTTAGAAYHLHNFGGPNAMTQFLRFTRTRHRGNGGAFLIEEGNTNKLATFTDCIFEQSGLSISTACDTTITGGKSLNTGVLLSPNVYTTGSLNFKIHGHDYRSTNVTTGIAYQSASKTNLNCEVVGGFFQSAGNIFSHDGNNNRLTISGVTANGTANGHFLTPQGGSTSRNAIRVLNSTFKGTYFAVVELYSGSQNTDLEISHNRNEATSGHLVYDGESSGTNSAAYGRDNYLASSGLIISQGRMGAHFAARSMLNPTSIASASSISPSFNFDTHQVTGSTTINTILVGGTVAANRVAYETTLIAATNATWAVSTAGNIVPLSTAARTAGQAYTFRWDSIDQKWREVGNGGFASRMSQLTKTTNYTVLATDVGQYFNNIGSSAAATNTLPTAAAGLHYYFYIDAAQVMAVQAVGSDTIRYGATVSAAAGNIYGSAIGNTLHVFSPKATVWIVDQLTGSWTGPQ